LVLYALFECFFLFAFFVNFVLYINPILCVQPGTAGFGSVAECCGNVHIPAY